MTKVTRQEPNNAVIGHIELAPDPPFAVDERHTLVSFIDYFRSVLARKAVGLSAEQLATRLPPSTLTLGGLLKHMALVENHWFVCVWLGEEEGEPWSTVDWQATPDWDFESAADDEPEQLLALFDAAVERSRLAIDEQLSISTPRSSHAAA